MKYMIEHEHLKRVLILCKKSIKRQWIREMMKFTDLNDTFFMTSVEGTAAKRKKLYKEFETKPKGIMVMNYHLVLNDLDILKTLGFKLICIDECHCIKAKNGKLNNAIKEIGQQADYNIFLTGTPIMSRPDDIYGIVQIADESFFGTWNKFESKHIVKEYNGSYSRLIGYKGLNELRDKVQSILIRRTEYEVTLELPKTIHHQMSCEWDKVQERISEAIKDKKHQLLSTIEASRHIKNPLPSDIEKKEKAEALIKGLAMAEQANANDPRLFLSSRSRFMKQEFGALVPENYESSGKVQTLLELVSEITDADNKVIIFSKFETTVSLVAKEIEDKLKLNVLQYTGKVDDEMREQHVEWFMTDDDYQIIIGTDAMAEGLNLHIANHVINIEQPDTPAIKIQRGGRARRASSTYDRVFIHDLITENSKDEERIENLNQIMGLVDGVVSIDESQRESLKKVMSQY